MKIIQFITGFYMGGAETLVRDYCIELKRRKNIEVIVICLNRLNNEREEELIRLGIKIYFCSDYVNNSIPGMIIFSRIKAIRSIIQEEQPDILHSHLPINIYVRYAVKKNNLKVFHTVHNEPCRIWNKTMRGIIDFVSAKKLNDSFDMKFIVLHNQMKSEVDKIFRINNSIVLNNGIYFEKFAIKDLKENIRNEYGIPIDAFVVGNIGRFDYQKNQLFLLEVFAEIRKRRANAYLLLVGGTGNLLGDIKKRIKELNLCGIVKIIENSTDIPRLLNTMDVFVFPSLFEGFPITLIEAQVVKLKCYISDVITEEVLLTPHIYKISLDKSAEVWAETVVSEVREMDYTGIEKYQICEVVNRLLEIYNR